MNIYIYVYIWDGFTRISASYKGVKKLLQWCYRNLYNLWMLDEEGHMGEIIVCRTLEVGSKLLCRMTGINVNVLKHISNDNLRVHSARAERSHPKLLRKHPATNVSRMWDSTLSKGSSTAQTPP